MDNLISNYRTFMLNSPHDSIKVFKRKYIVKDMIIDLIFPNRINLTNGEQELFHTSLKQEIIEYCQKYKDYVTCLIENVINSPNLCGDITNIYLLGITKYKLRKDMNVKYKITDDTLYISVEKFFHYRNHVQIDKDPSSSLWKIENISDNLREIITDDKDNQQLILSIYLPILTMKKHKTFIYIPSHVISKTEISYNSILIFTKNIIIKKEYKFYLSKMSISSQYLVLSNTMNKLIYSYYSEENYVSRNIPLKSFRKFLTFISDKYSHVYDIKKEYPFKKVISIVFNAFQSNNLTYNMEIKSYISLYFIQFMYDLYKDNTDYIYPNILAKEEYLVSAGTIFYYISRDRVNLIESEFKGSPDAYQKCKLYPDIILLIIKLGGNIMIRSDNPQSYYDQIIKEYYDHRSEYFSNAELNRKMNESRTTIYPLGYIFSNKTIGMYNNPISKYLNDFRHICVKKEPFYIYLKEVLSNIQNIDRECSIRNIM